MMRGGHECHPELFVEGKPKCLQGFLSLVTQGHRAQSQTGGSMHAPHSDTEMEVLSSKVRLEGPCRTWPEGCREAQGSQALPDPFPSSHLPHLPHLPAPRPGSRCPGRVLLALPVLRPQVPGPISLVPFRLGGSALGPLSQEGTLARAFCPAE